MKDLLNKIEQELLDKHLITLDVIPPKPNKCEWCNGKCKINELHYYHFDSGTKGWYSPECAYSISKVFEWFDEQ